MTAERADVKKHPNSYPPGASRGGQGPAQMHRNWGLGASPGTSNQDFSPLIACSGVPPTGGRGPEACSDEGGDPQFVASSSVLQACRQLAAKKGGPTRSLGAELTDLDEGGVRGSPSRLSRQGPRLREPRSGACSCPLTPPRPRGLAACPGPGCGLLGSSGQGPVRSRA